MTVKTHPQLPDLPDGQFFRIGQWDHDYRGEVVYVQIRQRKTFAGFNYSRVICSNYWDLDRHKLQPSDGGEGESRFLSSREAAIHLAEKLTANRLGDLEGDHPK